jgi:hypothetical protein
MPFDFSWGSATNSICVQREIKRSGVRRDVHTHRDPADTAPASVRGPPQKENLRSQVVHKKSAVRPQFFHRRELRASA